MNVRVLRFLPLIAWPFSTYAQDLQIALQGGGRSAICFQQQGPEDSQNGNAILVQLAAAKDESPLNLRITVDYHTVLEVKGGSMSAPEVTVRLTDVRISAAPSYRGFPMEDRVKPDRVACHLNLIDLPDSNILRQYLLSDLDVAQLAFGYTNTDIPVVQPGAFSVTLSDVRFHYSDEALKRFRDRIQLVHDYYASAALTDSLLRVTEGYDPLSVRDLPEKFIQLSEINRVVRIIDSHRFGEELSLLAHDPEHLIQHFSKLDKFSRSATMTFLDQLSDPAAPGYTGSLGDLSEAFVRHLLSYIRKSMLMSNERGGIYREYLESWFRVAGFEREGEVFKNLVQKMYPGEDPAISTMRISRAVCDAAFRAALQRIHSSDYAAAILLMRFMNSFREHNPFPDQIPDPNPLLIEAVKGTYVSYLGIAESCIEQQKWQMADTYIRRAEEYLAEFQEVIPVDTMYRRISDKLFNRQLERCDDILSANRFQEAYDCYQLFIQSYPAAMISYVDEHLSSRKNRAVKGLFLGERDRVEDFMQRRDSDSALACYDRACRYADMLPGDRDVIRVRSELDSHMLPVRYRELAGRGKLLYLGYNLEEAFRIFSQMKAIGEERGIPFDSADQQMYLASYKHHMLNEISMATGMIWKDEFDQAREYAREVESVMDLYNLETDPDLQAALSNYRRKIDLKACLNVKEESEMLSVRARRNIELKQFDLAVKQLGDARLLVRQHPDCGLSNATTEETIKRYLSAAFYQEKQQEAKHQVVTGRYREALQLIGDNERFYRNARLEQLGVPFIHPLDFVIGSSRVPLYLEAIRFFLGTGDVASSWSCLTRLREEGVDARDVKVYQETVGSAMAARDFLQYPGDDPGGRARICTGGNRWYARFESAYTDRWKQLQTAQIVTKP